MLDQLEQYPESERLLHYLLRFSCIAGDRALAREYFQRPGSGWSEDGRSIWEDVSIYEERRAWALREPVPGWELGPPTELPHNLLGVEIDNPVDWETPQRDAFLLRDDSDRLLLITASGLTKRAPRWLRTKYLIERELRVRRWRVGDLGVKLGLSIANVLKVDQPRAADQLTYGLVLEVAGKTESSVGEWVLTSSEIPLNGGRGFVVRSHQGGKHGLVPIRLPRRSSSKKGGMLGTFNVNITAAVHDHIHPGSPVFDELGYVVGVVIGSGVTEHVKGREPQHLLFCEEIGLLLYGSTEAEAERLVQTYQRSESDDYSLRLVVNKLLLERGYDELDALGQGLLLSRAMFDDGSWMISTFHSTLNRPRSTKGNVVDRVEVISLLEEWLKAMPTSSSAKIALVNALVAQVPRNPPPDCRDPGHECWSTALDQMQRMRSKLHRASELLEQADRNDPEYYLTKLRLIRARAACSDEMLKHLEQLAEGTAQSPSYILLRPTSSDADRQEIQATIEQAFEVVPAYLPLYQYLLRQRKRGTDDPSEHTAAQAVERTYETMGEAMYAQIALLVEMNPRVSLAAIGFDLQRVQQSLEDHLKLYPRSPKHIVRLLQLARASGDRETARKWIGRLQWSHQTTELSKWRREDYEECRRWALMPMD
jgi:hypothetical protein